MTLEEATALAEAINATHPLPYWQKMHELRQSLRVIGPAAPLAIWVASPKLIATMGADGVFSGGWAAVLDAESSENAYIVCAPEDFDVWLRQWIAGEIEIGRGHSRQKSYKD